MKLVVALITFSIMGFWLAISYFLLGHIEIPGVQLALPKTTSDFSGSAGILNGLFSSFAVVLALVAVLLQGRELKESTAAQNEQALALKEQLLQQQKMTSAQLDRSEALANQLKIQQNSNKIMLLQTKLHYHISEMDRMDSIIENIKGTKRGDNLFQNCVDKKTRHKEQKEELQKQLDSLM